MSETATETEVRGLEELARAWGVEASYVDAEGAVRHASSETLYRALAALGIPADRREQVEDALWDRQQALHLRILDPVTVLWDDEPPVVTLRLGRSDASARIDCRLETEGGKTAEWIADDPKIRLPHDLAPGYHDLTIQAGSRWATTRVIRAPRTVHDDGGRDWGAFLPLHALRSRRAWGTGDLTDLEALLDWTASLGGRAVGTLPILSSYTGRPFDPSPYAPVSRLFWNELYVDPERAPELAHSLEARELLASDAFRKRLREIRREPLVDYREAAALKRQVVEALARTFFGGDGWRSDEFHGFLGENPHARDYARFRGAAELWERGWREWPARMRGGEVRAGDFPENAARYHLYAQFLAARQLASLAGPDREARLYLDFPVGVHPDGFDTWRWPGLFAPDVTVGAPPDAFFAEGQDWGFPPFHPERLQADGYRYFAAAVSAACRYAGALRLDHVMALHRLWWVPRGAKPGEGVYVRYPSEEMWAVVCVESRRHRTAIAGEDLGTVPPETRAAMERHGARRAYVLPFELAERPPGLAPVPPRAVAALDTHDTPTFAAWWNALGPEARLALVEALGLRRGDVGPDLPESARTRAVLAAALRRLADSPAGLVLVNLEDLWLEEEPQNEPGTSMDEKPNWRRKARFALEMFREMPEVVDLLREIDSIRTRV